MARCTRELNSAPPAAAALISQIRDIEKRMYENGADRVRLAAAEGRMIAKLRDLLPHGKWLRTLKQACRLGRTQANTYMTLGDHPQTSVQLGCNGLMLPLRAACGGLVFDFKHIYRIEFDGSAWGGGLFAGEANLRCR